MATPQRPLDITWDDVRDSRKQKWHWGYFIPIIVILLAACCIYITTFEKSELIVESHAVEATPNIVAPVGYPKKKKVIPARDQFCETLRRWSEGTVLKMGYETRKQCALVF